VRGSQNFHYRPWFDSHHASSEAAKGYGMSIDQLLAAMDEVLEQGEALLTGLSDAQYAEASNAGGSIGAHYRHSLEHFKILFEAVKDSHIDYDGRERDPRLQTERLAALKTTRDFREAARFLSTLSPGRPLEVRSKISYAAAVSYAVPSTLGREIMYAVSHAIHHHALIGMICGLDKIPVPADFGVAPATIVHRQEQTIARRFA
jgi:uncharacterized damage-inducible protein DinB